MRELTKEQIEQVAGAGGYAPSPYDPHHKKHEHKKHHHKHDHKPVHDPYAPVTFDPYAPPTVVY